MRKVILDTDTDNEIDDQYALSYLLKSGRVEVIGITTAPYLNDKVASAEEGMTRSYKEIHHILSLLNMEKSHGDRVFLGSREFLHNEKDPIVSDAAKAIVELSKEGTPDDPVYVLAIGALTNVASAILLDPSIVERIHIIFLGGVAAHLTSEGWLTEFNLVEDVAAARIVFKKATNLTMLPCTGVVSELRTTQFELEHWLKGKNDLCDYLVKHTVQEAESYAKGKPWSRVIWDISAPATLFSVDSDKVCIKKTPRFIPADKFTYEPFEGSPINYVYLINRDNIFEDLFTVLAK